VSLSQLTDYLQRNADQDGSKAAVVFENQTISWSELWERVQQASGPIGAQLDKSPQNVVAILLPNSIDFIISYLAVVHSGHIALPIDPAYKLLEIRAILEQVPSKILITDQAYSQDLKHANIVSLSELYESKTSSDLLRLSAKDQIASLTFTSGTTGQPKAAPNTHANHIWNIKVCSEVWDWTPEDTILITVPLSHMLGIVMGLSGGLYHANTLYIHRWFDANQTLAALASGNISFFSHAASAYVKMAQVAGDGYDLSGVRLCVSGGAPLPPAVWQEFKNRYGIEILETYGTTETGRIAGNRLDERKLGSPGKALPGVELKLSPEQELLVRSDGVFPGYYNNRAASEAGFTPEAFWRTGDIAEIKDGYVFLKGRVQERIRRFGYTISPRDVEWAMHQLDGVNDIYVMGVQQMTKPDDNLVYFVSGPAEDEQIKHFCKQNLLFAWRPDKIFHLKEIPRTKSGKVHIGSLKQIAGDI
jgi:long-chain acyl-CoA synthetase